MGTQSRILLSLGSGAEGMNREERYLSATEKAGFNAFAEWARSVLDREADKLLGKSDKK